MAGSALVKDIRLILRDKKTVMAMASIVMLELFTLVYSHTVLGSLSDKGAGPQFNFLKNYFLFLTFPIIGANLITVIHLMSMEKNNFELCRLIPNGESSFLRSKAAAGTLISSILTLPFLFLPIFYSGLTYFQNVSILSFLFFFWFFVISGMSYLSVSYAASYFVKDRTYSPDLKMTMLLIMLLTSLSAIFFIYSGRFLWVYYDHAMGFNIKYPYKEKLTLLLITFFFMISSRIMLSSSVKRFSGK
jgi:hypothetical protein